MTVFINIVFYIHIKYSLQTTEALINGKIRESMAFGFRHGCQNNVDLVC